SHQGDIRKRISDSNAASSETTVQWDSGDDQRTESWHCFPQEMDFPQTLDISQTRINVGAEGSEVIEFPSLEEAVLTQSEDQVKERNRNLLCSPLLVIQDNFASPDLPLLTCLTQDQELGSDSLFHQSELDFAPLRGIPDKSDDIEWFSRPSEVSEALFQATSEVSSDLVNSCFSVSQHLLTGSTAVGSQRSFLSPEQENNKENTSSSTVDELKIPKDSDNYDGLSSYMSWKTRKDMQQSGDNFADKDQVSVSTLSDISDENIAPTRSDSFAASGLHVHWKQEALQQTETNKDHELQEKADSDDITLDNDTESYSLDENAVVCSESVADLQREPTTESEYHASNLRMLRVSLDTVPKTLQHLAGDISKGGIPEITQSKLKLGITTTPGDSDFESHLSMSPEDLPQLAVSSSQRNTIGQHTDVPNQKALTRSHLIEDNLKVPDISEPADRKTGMPTEPSTSYPYREKASILYQQNLPDSYPTEEALKVSAIPGSADQKTGISIVPSISHSPREKPGMFYQQAVPGGYTHQEALKGSFAPGPTAQKTVIPSATSPFYSPREKPGIFYQQVLPGGQIPAEALKVTAAPGQAGQKSSIPTVTSSPYSQRDQPGVFYQQVLPGGQIPAEVLKISSAPGPADQKTGIPTVTSFPYSQRDQPGVFYQQVLPGGQIPVEALKVSSAPGPASQKTGIPTLTSLPYSQRDLPGVFYQQALPGGQRPAETQKVSSAPGPAGQKTSILTVTSIPHSQRDQPGVFYQQVLPGGQRPAETLKVSSAPGPADQKTVIPPATSASYSPRDKPGVFYQQVLPGGQIPAETLKGSATPGPADQKTVIPPATSASYSPRDKPGVFYQQVLPGGQIPAEALKGSATPGPADQKTVIPPATSASYSPRDKPGVFYHQVLPGGQIPAETLKGSATPGPADQKAGIPPATSASYSPRDKPGVFYQQALPGGQVPAEAPKVSSAPGPDDQKTVIPLATSASYPQRDKPGVFYRQTMPGGQIPAEALKVSATPGPADQKTGIPLATSASYSPRDKPGVFYQQALPGGHIPAKVLKVSSAPGPADQKTSISPATSASYSPRDKPSVFYQQVLPGGQIPAEVLKVSSAPGPDDQKTGISPAASASYPQRDKPGVFYRQVLPVGQTPAEALKGSATPGPVDQKTVIPPATSASYSPRDKPGVFYQQVLPGGQIPAEALKGSATPGPVDQKTVIPPATSASYSPRDKPGVFYQQVLPGGQIPAEALKGSATPGPADQKAGIPPATSASYSPRDKPGVFYQQVLPGGHIPAEALKGSATPGPADQKTGISPATSASYSPRDKPGVFYQQVLPVGHISAEALKGSATLGPADQKTVIPPATSPFYSPRDKPGVFYQQALPGGQIPAETQKVSSAPGPAPQKTDIPSSTSPSYSQRDKSGVFYQQALPGVQILAETQKVSSAPGPAGQKTVTSISYSQRDQPGVFYQHVLPGGQIPAEVLKVSSAPGPAGQKTGILPATTASYSARDKPVVFYQQALPGGHISAEILNISPASGANDQKIGIPTITSASYSYRGEPSIFYQQELPESHLAEEFLSAAPGPADKKAGITTVSSASYPLGEKSYASYPQALPESHLTDQALKVSVFPGFADQKVETAAVSSTSYSHGMKPGTFYQQALPDTHITEETLKVPAIPGLVNQKTRIPTVHSSSYSQREKPGILYQQASSDSHPPKEPLEVSAVSGSADQMAGIPVLTSTSYSQRERSKVFYQQTLSDNHLTEEAQKVSFVPGPGDQKTGIPSELSSSYSREKSIIFSQQILPDSHLLEDTLKVLDDSGLADQKSGLPTVPSIPQAHREKPSAFYQQELPDSHSMEKSLKVSFVPEPAHQKTGIPTGPSTSYLYREKPSLKVSAIPVTDDQKTEQSISFQQELPDLTQVTLKTVKVPGPADQKSGISTIPLSYYSRREKPSVFSTQELPESHLTEEAPKISSVSVPNRILTVPSSSYSHQEKLHVSTVNVPDNQKTELPTATHSSHLQREKPRISTVIGPDDQKTPLLTVFHSSYSQRVKPGIFLEQQLPDRDQSEDILKISTVPEPTDVNTGTPITLSGSYLQKDKSNILYLQELPDRHQTEDALKVSTLPEPADQKTVTPTAPPSSFSYREKLNIFYQKDLPCRHPTEDALKVSSGLGKSDQITGLSIVSPGTYSHDKKHKLVSEHVQRLIDNLDSSDSSACSKHMPLNSQVDDGVVIIKPESIGFGDDGSEEIQDTENSSKTLKEIRTLLMEAENIALKRCNFPAPLVPFRDVSDISFIRSKKVVCFKEPPTTDVSDGDLLQRQPFIEENPSNRCIQKDIGTQTNLKCQRGIENWEFIRSTTIRSPLQEAESKARMALGETLRQYEAAKSALRSEPERYSRTIGNKIIIPMMTIIKSDSSSDVSDGNGSCSWDSNLPESLESVSDVLLNFFPYTSPNTSITDSREEQGMSESEDGGGSIDSLAARVKNLLQCESSLNHAKQVLRNAEEEECRVRARAWNLKFNLAHECGYSISELNEDDRRKVEEIKAELFGHGRTNHLSEGLQSPRGIGCTPEAVCSHIVIESHEKGCFRTLTTEQPQLEDHPCAFTSAESSEMIRERQSPSSWRARHINLSKSLDQNNPHFKVWNSLQLQSHSPLQNLITDDFKISKGLRMPFRENMDPWLSELVEVEPACVPPKEVDFPSSSQIPPPEPMKQFTTSITFSSHRHSQCISDSSVFKVGVTEGSQCTGASMGVFNSHITEEQNSSRDLKQKISSPSSFKMLGGLPHKAVTILAEKGRQNQKLFVDFEPSHREEKLLERSDFNVSHFEPSTSANCTFKEVQFSDNHTHISMGRSNSTLGVKEKNVTNTADLPSHIFLEQRELFEQSKAPHADHHVRKHHSCLCPDLPACIFLEQQELFEQSKAPHVDHEMRESHSPFPLCQDYIASNLPSPIFLEQHQSRTPGVDDHMRKHHFPFSQGQDCVVEKNQHTPKSHITNINVEVNNSISQTAPDHYTLETSASTPPSNRKALSCVRITLCPKTPSKLDSGTLGKRFHSLDSASKTRMNSEFNSDLQTISSRSLEPTSKLLTSKPIAQNQESLGFLGPKSPLDFQVVQSPLPDSNTITQDLKAIPSQNSQIVTSRQIQVNISDLEGYSKPEGTPVSADRLPEQNKTSLFAFSGKLSSDAVTQITTESPEKTILSSEIFINAGDHGSKILEPSSKKLQKGPVKFASSSSVQQITTCRGTDAQPLLLPYKPSGSTKMYYVPQLETVPSFLDSKSDTTIESSHSGSNDAIAPEFPAQVLGTRDDDLSATVNIKHKEGIYSKRAVPKASFSLGKKPLQTDNAGNCSGFVYFVTHKNLSDKKQKEENSSQRILTKEEEKWPEEEESLQNDTAGSSDATTAKHLIQVQDIKVENLPDTKPIEHKEEIYINRAVPKEAWSEKKESLQIDISESECHSEFENTTHSVFRSAKFYFHHPVHLLSEQDFCHESLGRSVLMRHSWKDFFHHHSDKHREHTCLPLPYQNVDKTMDYTRIKSLSINMNVGDKEVTTKSQARDHLKSNGQINDPKRDEKVTPELTTPHTASLNELWNKYQERQRQQKLPDVSDRKELSLVERLDRLAKLLQNPITHSLQASESIQDDNRREQIKEWSYKQKQQKSKFQKQKRYKSIEKGHKNICDLKKCKVLSPHQSGRSNQIKIEQIKFDKYILRKQPDLHYISNTSSDSRPSEESELFTDTPTNILSTTTSPVESDIMTQTDREVTLHERSSSISTIDTARLIQAFGHERVCLSPRRVKLYSSITNQQRRYLEKRCKHKKSLNTGYPQMTSEHTRRRHIQVANHMISSDSVSHASSLLSLNSAVCKEENVHMLNKGIQAGSLEIVHGDRKYTRDVGVTFPTPSSSEARLEEDSDVTSWSEEKVEEKMPFTSYLGDKKLKKNKENSCEGVSWFVPVENLKTGSKKENLPKFYGPGISWFEPITKTKPWREPLREQNWQGQRTEGWGSLADPARHDGRDLLKPFVRATLQEALHLHRPDFISRSGERIKRLKLIVQERKLQNMFQSERDVLFNTTQPQPRKVFMAARKNKPIGKKEMIQRSKRIYEQLPEVQKKREEEKRKLEYKSYRLRAQLYKMKVTNRLLGRKVPWD
uniref:ALMS1 centrosome and basal body associated protein n=1 Tax=Sciurus vulgaris TaxID=55149 RepID=A0A8D2DJB9_SCIVU